VQDGAKNETSIIFILGKKMKLSNSHSKTIFERIVNLRHLKWINVHQS